MASQNFDFYSIMYEKSKAEGIKLVSMGCLGKRGCVIGDGMGGGKAKGM